MKISPSIEEIKEARLGLGITQAQAAAIIESSWRTWQSYEIGARKIHHLIWRVWRIRAGLDKPASILKR